MIIISACLAGVSCRYDGGSFTYASIASLVAAGKAIVCCPEVAGGLPVPRKPIELNQERRAFDADGIEYTPEVETGIESILQSIQSFHGQITAAILKDKSPTCGSCLIYDGSFNGNVTTGLGLFAAELIRLGIPVYTENTCKRFN